VAVRLDVEEFSGALSILFPEDNIGVSEDGDRDMIGAPRLLCCPGPGFAVH
jgi:hypothetical protein